MDIGKAKTLANEIISVGRLEQFESSITAIVVRVLTTPNCRMSCDYRADRSVCEQSSFKSHIRLGVKNVIHPLHLVWCILHEFGHHLSGMKAPNDDPFDREIKAWDFAALELLQYPELHIHWDNFDSYRYSCLKNHSEFYQKHPNYIP